jgi:phenylpyruvate tautomerase PptA (4-oxalocrotonate tautomerase family)
MIVGDSRRPDPHTLAERLADTLAWPASGTWVLAQHIPDGDYGEGQQPHPSPIIARVLKRHHERPLGQQAALLGSVIAEAYSRDPSTVHVIFEAPGAGRVFFGASTLGPH